MKIEREHWHFSLLNKLSTEIRRASAEWEGFNCAVQYPCQHIFIKAFLHKPLSFRLIFTDIFLAVLKEYRENEGKERISSQHRLGLGLSLAPLLQMVFRPFGHFVPLWLTKGLVMVLTLARGSSSFFSLAPGH